MKVVNFFAGPGTGKSTMAATIFARLKAEGYTPELVTEYAKELTYAGRHDTLKNNQLLVSGMQWERMRILDGSGVDCVITDSPILLGAVYGSSALSVVLWQLHNQCENLNIVLGRKKAYVKVGRSQTEEEAVALDGDIIDMLRNFEGVSYTTMCSSDFDGVYNLVKDWIKEQE